MLLFNTVMIFRDRMSEYIYLATKVCSNGLFITGVSWQIVNILFVPLQFNRIFVQGNFAFMLAFLRVFMFCGEPQF